VEGVTDEAESKVDVVDFVRTTLWVFVVSSLDGRTVKDFQKLDEFHPIAEVELEV